MMTFPRRPEHPDIPYPYPPEPDIPRRTGPILVPTVDMPGGDARERLRNARTVFVSGPLDGAAVSSLCAELMAFDGESAADVEVIVNSPGGPIDEVSAVLDVIELMRAAVNATVVGAARGTAGVLAASANGRRRAAPNATISLRCETPRPSHGTAEELARAAEEALVVRRRLSRALVAATGQPETLIDDELDRGVVHDAPGALALGLIDEIGRPRR